MRLDELNWMDVEEYLKQDDRLILILGATEQHGYLSLLTDVKIPQALADVASQQTNVLVAPPLNFGCSPYFLAYPGTISLRVSTLIAAAEDIIRSVYQGGFRRILILNGHGGNDAVNTHLSEVINHLPGLQLRWHSWWESHSVEAIAEKYKIKPAHANWVEAFAFAQVSELPTDVKPPPRVPGLMDAARARQIYGDGSFGGPYQAEKGIMQELFSACLQDILVALRFE